MKNINLTVSALIGTFIAINVAHAASVNASHNDLSKRAYTRPATHEAEPNNQPFEGASLVRKQLETDAALTHDKQYQLLRSSQLARRPF